MEDKAAGRCPPIYRLLSRLASFHFSFTGLKVITLSSAVRAAENRVGDSASREHAESYPQEGSSRSARFSIQDGS